MITYQHEFIGKKPSKEQIIKRVLAAKGAGWRDIEIIWKENILGFHLYNNQWAGFGWIKDISGQDIAKEILV